MRWFVQAVFIVFGAAVLAVVGVVIGAPFWAMAVAAAFWGFGVASVFEKRETT